MKKLVFIVSFLSITSMALLAGAQSKTVTNQKLQEKQITQGVRQGTLTRSEARRLRTQQREIRMMKANAAKDGVITMAEKRRIRHAEQMASYAIYRQKHNAAVR